MLIKSYLSRRKQQQQRRTRSVRPQSKTADRGVQPLGRYLLAPHENVHPLPMQHLAVLVERDKREQAPPVNSRACRPSVHTDQQAGPSPQAGPSLSAERRET